MKHAAVVAVVMMVVVWAAGCGTAGQEGESDVLAALRGALVGPDPQFVDASVREAPLGGGAPGDIEVSLPVQVTSDSYYERGQSIVYDGSEYWLFYGRSDTVTANYQTGDPDTHDYRVYYKKASSVADLSAATASLVGGASNSNGYLGETGAAYSGGDVWAFATIDIGANADLYGWWTSDGGTNWNEVGPIISALSDGQAHHDEVAFGGELWVVEGSGNFTTMHSATPKVGGWSTPLNVDASLTGGLARFFADGTDLYLAINAAGMNYIYKYNPGAPPAWDKVDDNAPPNPYDPTLFKVGSSYVFAQAPWDGTKQYILAWSGATLDSTFFDTTYKMVTEGAYGSNPWVDMWPIGFTDDSGDSYLFFTSERNPSDPSSEIAGNIWCLKYDWDVTLDHYTYIQEAIDAASGTTISVAPGTYEETLNIEGQSDLAIVGEDRDTVIVKADSTLAWDVGGYGSARQAVVRNVNSTNITLQDITFDFDTVKGNSVFGIMGWDSSVTVDNCVVKNMSLPDATGGYAELGTYFRAPGFTDTSRAAVVFTGNTFIDAGRVGIVTHDYIDFTITSNTFYKDMDDFGYAIEVGSQSTGTVSNNKIYGYDTPAASDGSESAGIYVENCFTGGSPSVTKNVIVSGNEIYDCQYAMWIGNGYTGYAGDVDIVVTVSGNNFHDNVDGAVILQDEDKEAGSSVNATFEDNDITNNGDVGLWIFTQGDGDITASLSGNIISGHDAGVYVNDYASGTSASSYSISVNQNGLAGNTSVGVQNDYAGTTVDASANWWGDSDPDTVAGEVSGNADFTPVLVSGDTDAGTVGFQSDLSELTVHALGQQSGSAGRVQEGVNLVSGSTVNVAAGTYNERLSIGKSVDLRGAQYGVNPTLVGARTNSAAESVITEAGLSTPNPDVLIEIPTSVTNVAIDGFTLVGDPTNATADTCVVRCWDDNTTLANNVIDGKLGLLCKGGDGVTVRRNRVVVNKNGVVVQPGVASNVSVADNAFSLGSVPAGDESAIYVTGCTGVDVTGNRASGFVNGKGVTGSNLTNVTVSRNTFTGNNDAVSFWGTTTYVDIDSNVLDDSLRYGISIKGQDITISNNHIDGSGDVGVNIDHHVIDTERVVVRNNQIEDSANFGVRIGPAVSHAGNAVHHNNFVNNGGGTYPQAKDESAGGNTWYDVATNEGNYWSDYTGVDGDADGIGDTAYVIDTDPVEDPYPLMAPAAAGGNILQLDVNDSPLYVPYSTPVVIDLAALNLLQKVTGVQALIGFSSTYLTSPNVVVGGYPWDVPIYQSMPGDGELDTMIGVNVTVVQDAGGTDADATTAVITFTSGTTDGTTEVVFRPDGTAGYETFFSAIDPDGLPVAVYPTKIDGQTIVVDGTDPSVQVTYPNGGENFKGGGSETITWTASDTNIDYDSVEIEYFNGAAWQVIATGEDNDGAYVWDPIPSLDIDTALVRVTVSDLAGNSASDDSDAVFIIDSTAPSVDDIAATQDGGPDLTPSGTAIQGVVDIAVTTSDNLSGVAGEPTVTVTPDGGSAEAAAFVNESPPGTYNYTWSVTATTPNGPAVVTVSGLTDNAGNVAANATDTFTVDKNQVVATVELQALAADITRNVTFVFTDSSYVELKRVTVPVDFLNATDQGTVTLTEAPEDMAHLSAKTAWNLRVRLDVALDEDGQATASFTGDDKLLGGDINGDNIVNTLDYTLYAMHYNTTNEVADINGDGAVNTPDYTLIAANAFERGDDE